MQYIGLVAEFVCVCVCVVVERDYIADGINMLRLEVIRYLMATASGRRVLAAVRNRLDSLEIKT